MGRVKWILGVAAGLIIAALITVFLLRSPDAAGPSRVDRAIPVATATVESGPIELRRTFTGAMEAYSSFLVAPKIGGRIRSIHVDISDPVQLGQVVARLDDAEIESEEAQANAALAVAEASQAEARSLAEVSNRDLKRLEELRGRGFTSDSEFDVAEAEYIARQSQLKVAEAQVARAQAALNATRIRRSYSSVVTDWDGRDIERIVAERFVDEGETVSANTPLLRIVEIDRMIAAITVTERDYAYLEPDQPATLVTDTYPGVAFHGTIKRIAPVFREATRQARVEIKVPNPDRMLKPGMFMRAALVLRQVEQTNLMPEAALTRRQGSDGVFVLAPDGESVRWAEVTTGLRDGDTVEVFGVDPGLEVVVLGQHLLDDGSRVTLPELVKPDPSS